MHPGPLLPAADSNVVSVAYTPDGTLFVVASPPSSNSAAPASTDVLRCPPSNPCTTVLSDSRALPLTLMVSRGYATDRSLALVDPPQRVADISVDGGSTFQQFPLSPDVSVVAAFLVPRPQPPASLVVDTIDDNTRATLVVESDDGGRSAHPVTTYTPHGVDFADAVVLPDRILVALNTLDGTGGAGVRCTQDGGATWRHSCIA